MSDETNLYFNLDDEDNEKRVVVRVSELVRCLKHFRESLLCNGGDYEHDMREIGGHLKAATLGGGTLTAKQVSKAVYAHSIHADCADADWQAIADELNAELGGGNCARCAEDMGRYADSLCDPLKERIAELLRCLENDWHIHASWDGLRKFWCIELTEEGVRMRDAACGTLTAEQVREAIMSVDRWEKPMGNTGMTNTHLIIRDDGWQAIADELNARAERTCRNTHENRWFKCSACGYGFTDLYAEDEGDIDEQPRYCPNCGCKVVGE